MITLRTELLVGTTVRLMPTGCAAGLRGRATSGTWMRCFLKINGRLHYLWRAVDQDGDVLDILVQRRRDKKAAKKFFRKLLKGLRYVPRVLITGKLKSYHSAKQEIMPSVGIVRLTAEDVLRLFIRHNPFNHFRRSIIVVAPSDRVGQIELE